MLKKCFTAMAAGLFTFSKIFKCFSFAARKHFLERSGFPLLSMPNR